jgi:hypothetical protein
MAPNRWTDRRSGVQFELTGLAGLSGNPTPSTMRPQLGVKPNEVLPRNRRAMTRLSKARTGGECCAITAAKADATITSHGIRANASVICRDPFGGRVCGHVDLDKLAPSQPDNDQNVEQIKADGRDDEQVHGCDLRQVVAQECAPALTRRAAVRGGHVPRHGRLSDRKAKLVASEHTHVGSRDPARGNHTPGGVLVLLNSSVEFCESVTSGKSKGSHLLASVVHASRKRA